MRLRWEHPCLPSQHHAAHVPACPVRCCVAAQEISIPSKSWIRVAAHLLVYNLWTDTFMMFVVIANTIVMFTVRPLTFCAARVLASTLLPSRLPRPLLVWAAPQAQGPGSAGARARSRCWGHAGECACGGCGCACAYVHVRARVLACVCV